MERITKIRPAWDKRNPDPKKDYGIHSMQIWMILKGDLGAVHFTFSTGIFLEETEKRLAKEGSLDWEELSPGHWFSVIKAMGYDVGYHSPKPLYEGQEVVWPTKRIEPKKKAPMNFEDEDTLPTYEKIGDAAPVCEWLGVPCYCDGSAMRAEEWFNILRAEGSDKIWEMMEAEYQSRFEETL